MGGLRCLLFAALLFGTTSTLTRGAAQANVQRAALAAVARLESATCPFKLGKGMVEGETVSCGYLVVPEDYAKPEGRTVQLSVAVFKSPASKPAPAPLIFLQGGPGGAIVAELGSSITSKNAAKTVGNQDLILIDQRGNGLSKPYLDCKALRDLMVNSLAEQGSAPQDEAAYVSTAQACYNTLDQAGIDLNTYTTINDARDIAELGPALGYKQVNIYGVSYGTRVALTMLRLYPANIRSVIIDGVLPTQANLITQMPASMGHVFPVLFTGCAEDSACNKAYPHLDSTFYDLVDRLNAKPVTLTVKNPDTGEEVKLTLTGDGFVETVYQLLYTTANIPYIPRLIYQTDKGSYNEAATLELKTRTDVEPAGSDTSEGTYFSVECGEDAPYTNADQIMAAIRKLPSALQSNAETSQISLYHTCTQAWHVAKVDATQKQAVQSGIPTLVLNGEYDPITPPSLGQQAASTLSKSHSYTFPGVGHGAYLSGVACPHSMALAFLANPAKAPDAKCIKTMTGPKWVTTPKE